MFSKGSTLNSHDWIQLMQSAGPYVLSGLYPTETGDFSKTDVLLELVNVCNLLLRAVSTAEDDDEFHLQMDEMKARVVEALCKCEAVFPRTELCVMLHLLMHVPDVVYKWNSVSNFWSFFGERYGGMLFNDVTKVGLLVNSTWCVC